MPWPHDILRIVCGNIAWAGAVGFALANAATLFGYTSADMRLFIEFMGAFAAFGAVGYIAALAIECMSEKA